MLLPFLRQQLELAKRGEITNALANCHVEGLSSVVFVDRPTHRIRMFFAHHNHELWKNNPQTLSAIPMSLGFHGHRQEITLVRIFGEAYNVIGQPTPHVTDDAVLFGRYRIDSRILGGTGAMIEVSPPAVGMNYTIQLIHEAGIVLPSTLLHTVYVPRQTEAAWLVIEGDPCDKFDGITYTNNPKFDSTYMYQKMAYEEIIHVLFSCMVQLKKLKGT